jgi:hypothetical protein
MKAYQKEGQRTNHRWPLGLKNGKYSHAGNIKMMPCTSSKPQNPSQVDLALYRNNEIT